MPLSQANKTNIAYKNLLGKSQTDAAKELANESVGLFFNVPTNTIFADSISSTPSIAIANGIVSGITADLILDPTSNGHGYLATYPSTHILSGQTITNSINPSFDVNYTARVYSDAGLTNEIAGVDDRFWVFQYNSGVYFQEIVASPAPLKIVLYVYTGIFLNTYLTNISSVAGSGVSFSTFAQYTGTTAPTLYAPLSHTGDTSNPHNVTAAQISAYTYSQSDANFVSALTYNTFTATTNNILNNHLSAYTYFTGTTAPETYAKIANLNSHTGNTDNPHNVAAAQISAYTYTQSDANFVSALTYNTFTANTLLSQSAFTTWTSFYSHTGNTDNPHNVTAAQISAYTYTQANTNFVSALTYNTFTANTLLSQSAFTTWTVYNQYTGVTAPTLYSPLSHTGDTNNPHNVTTDQISAVTLNTNQFITGLKTFTTGMNILGDLYVSGATTYVNTTDLNIADNFITLNNGETGSGVTRMYSGFRIDRGVLSAYTFLFDETTDTFRVGVSDVPTGGTQSVATREDNPINTGIAIWNASQYRFDTTLNPTVITLTATTLYGNLNWDYLYNKPTTLSGYGITDAYTKTEVNNNFVSAATFNNHVSSYNSFTASTLLSQSSFTYYTGTTAPETYAKIANLNSHTGNTDNPHNVTAVQISAYTYSQSDANFVSTLTYNTFTASTLLSQSAFTTLTAYNQYTATTNNTLNNHLSAYTYFTGTTVPNTYATIVNLNSHTGNTSNPHNVTAAQISAYTIAQATAVFVVKSGDTMIDLTITTLSGVGSRLVYVDTLGKLSETNEYVYKTSTNSILSGLTTIDIFSSGDSKGVQWVYVVDDGTNFRAGTFLSVWGNGFIEYSETTTQSIGDTNFIDFSTILNNGNIILQSNVSSGTWSVSTSRFMIG